MNSAALIRTLFAALLSGLLLSCALRPSASSAASAACPQTRFSGQFAQRVQGDNNGRLRARFRAYHGRGDLRIGGAVQSLRLNGQAVPLESGGPEQAINRWFRDGDNYLEVQARAPAAAICLDVDWPVLQTATPEKQARMAAALHALTQQIEAEIDAGFSGASLLVIQHAEVVFQRHWGYALRYDKQGLPLATPVMLADDTLFDLASNTKMYATNLALMHLHATGRLDLDAPVQRYLPAYVGDGRELRSVRDLLTHSAGYAPEVHFHRRNGALGERFFSQDKQRTSALLMQVPFVTARGEKTVYSDTDYLLLGAIVEAITGQALDHYTEQQFYRPLQLLHSVFNPLQKNFRPQQVAATEVSGNSRAGTVQFDNMRQDVVQGEVHDEKAFYAMQGVAGHAGLFSTRGDLAVLLQLFLNGGGYGAQTFFDETTLMQFIKPADRDSSFGMGWQRSGDLKRPASFGPWASAQAYGHSGWTGTFTLIDPAQDLGIVLLTNKKHSPLVVENGVARFQGDSFQTGRYGEVIAQIYQAIAAASHSN